MRNSGKSNGDKRPDLLTLAMRRVYKERMVSKTPNRTARRVTPTVARKPHQKQPA